jgi:hypothetical protein
LPGAEIHILLSFNLKCSRLVFCGMNLDKMVLMSKNRVQALLSSAVARWMCA